MEIPGYSNVSLIGSGGNAHVYQATSIDSDDVVAIKVLHGGGDEAVARRFERERTLMAELDSIASVVPVYESGFLESGDPFIVMPLYDGGSLQDVVDMGPLPWREALQLTKTIAESIALAHAKRILHLDVKPANVLIDDEGEAWLADFGIAETMGPTSSMSAKMMTPAFTSPERIEGSEPDEQSDIYGVVATLFALLAGRRPYVTPSTSNVIAVANAVQNDPIPIEWIGDDVPESVKNLVLRGMAKEPSDRPRSAIELVGLIEDVLADRDVAGPAPVSPDDLAPTIDEDELAGPVRDRAQLLRVAAIVLLLATSVVAAIVLLNNDNPDDVETARVEAVELATGEADEAVPAPDPEADVEVVELEVVDDDDTAELDIDDGHTQVEGENSEDVGADDTESDELDADEVSQIDVAGSGVVSDADDANDVLEPESVTVVREVVPVETEVAGVTETTSTTTTTAAPSTTTTTAAPSTTTTTAAPTTTTAAPTTTTTAAPQQPEELCAGETWITDRDAVEPAITMLTNKTAEARRGPSLDGSCSRGFTHARNAEFVVSGQSGDFYWAENTSNGDVGWVAKADLALAPDAPPEPADSDADCPDGEWVTDREAINPAFTAVATEMTTARRGPSLHESCDRGFQHARSSEFLVSAQSGDFYWVENLADGDVGWIAKSAVAP